MNSIIVLIGAVVTAVSLIPIFGQIFGKDHPRGLIILFFAETWERFSFYGMRGLLIFYLTQHFLLDQKEATTRYLAYTTLYSTLPMLAAIIVDRWLGTRKAVAFGCLVLVAGHLTMAIEGAPAQSQLNWHGQSFVVETHGRTSEREVALDVGGKAYKFHANPDGALVIEGLAAGGPLPSVIPKADYKFEVLHQNKFGENMLFLALGLIVIGVSFLKTGPLVAQLYDNKDPRRDAGFTIFYYGVNLGAFWAGILCAWLGTQIGWWAGFGAAAAGMSIGYVVFVLGKPLLMGRGEPPDPVLLAKPVVGPLNREWIIYLGALATVGLVFLLLPAGKAVGILLAIVTAIALGYLGVYMVRHCTPVQRRRIGLAFILMLGSVVFWTLFEQAGSSLALFAQSNTQLTVQSSPIDIGFLGHHLFIGSKPMLDAAHLSVTPGHPIPGLWWIDSGIDAAQTQSLNPGFIILLAPIFAAMWAWLGRRKADPPTMVKFGLALLQVGGGFLFLVLGAQYADPTFRVPLYFLVGCYFLHTTGELCLSPVGLSVVSRLAPSALVATMLGLWGLSSGWARFIGGIIAQMTATESVGGKVLDPAKALATSCNVFMWIGVIAICAGGVFFLLAPLVRAWGDDAALEAEAEASPLAAAAPGVS